MIRKFRKRPAVVEAIRFNGSNYEEMRTLAPDAAFISDGHGPCSLIIVTSEGNMVCSPGDYLIKGVNGEFYPCKPEIFLKTYDEVEELNTASPSQATA